MSKKLGQAKGNGETITQERGIIVNNKQEISDTLAQQGSVEYAPEKFPTSKIFEGTVQDKLTANMIEGIINFDGKNYTFVREEGIPKAFEQMDVEVKDCADWKEATVYLKEFFAAYVDQYPKLFTSNITHWDRVDNNKIFLMINKWAQDHNIPYAGTQYYDGDREGGGMTLYVWLPIRIMGKFVYIFSNLDDKNAYFYCIGGSAAHLAVCSVG